MKEADEQCKLGYQSAAEGKARAELKSKQRLVKRLKEADRVRAESQEEELAVGDTPCREDPRVTSPDQEDSSEEEEMKVDEPEAEQGEQDEPMDD